MRIRIDVNGRILAFGIDSQITRENTYEVTTTPDDFLDFFSLGKYIAPGGVIEEVMDWIDPNS